MQKGVVVDLLDEEIRHVGARDEPACPVARIGQRAIGVSLRPTGQDHGTHDHPLELAPADDASRHVFVVKAAPKEQMNRRKKKNPAVAAAVARPEAGHADQPLARTECSASRAAFTASRPIPLLAPMIRTVATASCSTAELAWHIVMCDAVSPTARWASALKRVSKGALRSPLFHGLSVAG